MDGSAVPGLYPSSEGTPPLPSLDKYCIFKGLRGADGYKLLICFDFPV
jgi:hypothetical protein